MTLDLDENGVHSRRWARGEYPDKKSRKKKPLYGNKLPTEQKTSTYSSSSRLTSYLKGQSLSDAENFKASESVFFNQLTEKYVPRGSAPEKIREEMELAL